ncbi:hypothetical protein BDA96_07G242300 [Sorghum bicolor]|uniref:Uncharacterized protein n=1 Tax=Sorghum bicolor TaxID=4558 RepID=A0A921QPQ9_SORBI|nr:hypothetical protein BDA96_07G242300 [Sorghum bicolor]
MTTRNGQIKNFISNSSSFFYFFILKYPSLLLFIKVTIFVGLVFYRFLLPLVLLVSQLDLALLSSCFLITLPPEVQNPQALAHLEGLNFYPRQTISRARKVLPGQQINLSRQHAGRSDALLC